MPLSVIVSFQKPCAYVGQVICEGEFHVLSTSRTSTCFAPKLTNICARNLNFDKDWENRLISAQDDDNDKVFVHRPKIHRFRVISADDEDKDNTIVPGQKNEDISRIIPYISARNLDANIN